MLASVSPLVVVLVVGVVITEPVDLADVLTGDNVIESVRNNEERLLPHIPNQVVLMLLVPRLNLY